MQYGAEWTAIFDNSAGLVLDLHNPFETEERWRPVRREQRPYESAL